MTISSTTRKAGPFTGTGLQTVFPFTFKVFAAADLLAVQAVTATGVETTKLLTTDYTVALNADQNVSPGGNLTMLVAPPVGTTLTLTSQVANTQSTDLTNAGGFYPKVITDALDRATIQIQQIAASVGRSLGLSISAPTNVSTTLPYPVAGTFLGWNALGTAIQNYAAVASAAVSSFMVGVLAATDASAAQTALGFSTFFKTLVTAANAAVLRALLFVAPRASRLDVASVAGVVDLTANAPDTDDIRITGALAIAGFTLADGRVVRVTAGGAFTLTNGANLVTQTGANIVCAAGDTFSLRGLAAGVVEVLQFVAAIVQAVPSVRQTVLSGPVDANGLSAYGSTGIGTATLTATGTLDLTCFAGGQANRRAQVTNLQFTSPGGAGTAYLFAAISSGSVATQSVRTLPQALSYGSSASIVNGQITIGTQEGIVRVGNGAIASQVYEVAVGECTYAGGVWTGTPNWYTQNDKFVSVTTATLPGLSTAVSANHNMGFIPKVRRFVIVNITGEGGFTIGMENSQVTTNTGSAVAHTLIPSATSTAMRIATSNSTAFSSPPFAGGATFTLTAANWSYRFEAERGW